MQLPVMGQVKRLALEKPVSRAFEMDPHCTAGLLWLPIGDRIVNRAVFLENILELGLDPDQRQAMHVHADEYMFFQGLHR